MNSVSLKRGVGLVLLLVFLLGGCDMSSHSGKSYPFDYANGTMGTSFSIKVSRLPEAVSGEALQQRIDILLQELNAMMSTYLSDSELSRFNKSQSTEWVRVSPPLFEVLNEAKRVFHESGGAFDVTVGPLVNLWGFGPDPISFTAPADERIIAALQLVGSNHLLLDNELFAIKKTIGGLYVDLSALAKGYAVDRVALLLEELGIKDYLVEIGGEIRLKGLNVDQKSWRIAIEKPTVDKRMIQKVIPITDIAIATSGDYRNFFEVNGVRFSHTIDPRHGKPITHKLASVTVLSDNTMSADAWATALMVLGPEQGYRLAEQKRIPALFIVKTKSGFAEKSTSALNEFVEVKS